MLRPDPKVWRDRWVVDLRTAGFGQRYALGPATLTREDALHAAYETLTRLRRGVAEPAQRDMFDDAAPRQIGGLIDRWAAEKRYDREGSARYGKTYTRLVRSDLGGYSLAEFMPPQGNGRLAGYVRALEARELSGRTIRNYLSIIEQALRFAVERGWLVQAPLHPRLPPKAPPVFRWLTHQMFRALRAEIFRGVSLNEMQRTGVADAHQLALHVEYRRIYLSWIFYTGAHHHDADTATTDWLFLDGEAYIRHNNKSSRVVQDEQFEMPLFLLDDLRALEKLLGRPFYPGESFTGGPWPECARVMQKAAKRLKFPHGANPSILRRSYAREMYLRGYTVREVADRMGHVDERMLTEIYVRTPRGGGRVKSRWDRTLAVGGLPSGLAQILQLHPSEDHDK